MPEVVRATPAPSDQQPSQEQPKNKKQHRNGQISGFYIGYIGYKNIDGILDYVYLYNEMDAISDGHSAEYGQVSFMGRNEPIWIYKSGSPRKFRLSITLIASNSFDEPATSTVRRKTRDMHRDALSPVDVDFLARTMLAWTYSDMREQFSAPTRVWVSYGKIFQDIPCIVEKVERTVEKSFPWQKLDGDDIDMLPHVQKVSIDFLVCPETLYEIPGSADIATRDLTGSANANEKYGSFKNFRNSQCAVGVVATGETAKEEQEMAQKIDVAQSMANMA